MIKTGDIDPKHTPPEPVPPEKDGQKVAADDPGDDLAARLAKAGRKRPAPDKAEWPFCDLSGPG
jgi:hypothetical protein